MIMTRTTAFPEASPSTSELNYLEERRIAARVPTRICIMIKGVEKGCGRVDVNQVIRIGGHRQRARTARPIT